MLINRKQNESSVENNEYKIKLSLWNNVGIHIG